MLSTYFFFDFFFLFYFENFFIQIFHQRKKWRITYSCQLNCGAYFHLSSSSSPSSSVLCGTSLCWPNGFAHFVCILRNGLMRQSASCCLKMVAACYVAAWGGFGGIVTIGQQLVYIIKTNAHNGCLCVHCGNSMAIKLISNCIETVWVQRARWNVGRQCEKF